MLLALPSIGLCNGCARVKKEQVSFSRSADVIEAYDFLEIEAKIGHARTDNPFLDAKLRGLFRSADGKHLWDVDGFCDSDDGSTFRIRFMPPAAGDYQYALEYRQGDVVATGNGAFRAVNSSRRGPIRINAEYPWHFIWEGTGQSYFFNGTTAYWLMGWKNESIIQGAIERLHKLKVNRVRVTVAGRTNNLHGEPVMIDDRWTTFLTPWPSKLPEDIYHPDFDYTKFYLPFWQKFDRMLRFARDRDMIISLVLDMNDSHVHPEAGSSSERRYLSYVVARLGAFSNITWDLGDDLDQYRSVGWTHETGSFLEQLDPYHHLATSHPVNVVNQDLGAAWFGFTSYQEWSRKQHAFMLNRRKRQETAGRIIPQTNEEYGYEDHYPMWAEGLGSESADTLRRCAWDICMAGGYQTTGETARQGTNIWPDTGGGWLNGRGDDTMRMLEGYGHLVDFFTSFEWWKADPHDELVTEGNYCLAQPGRNYAVYMPHGGRVKVHIQAGPYRAEWFNPTTGQKLVLPSAVGPYWTSPTAPDGNDWAILLQRM